MFLILKGGCMLIRSGSLRSVFLMLMGLAFLTASCAVQASPADKLVEFYTSCLPMPPKVEIDVAAVNRLVQTGDIIIENHRGFPQWYAAIALMVPNTRFVHAGMIIKGHVLLGLSKQFAQTAQTTEAMKVIPTYRRELVSCTTPKGTIQKWQWVPNPTIYPNRAYVITPEVVGGNGISRTVALDLWDYLLDPAIRYSVKHIKVIRPPVKTQKLLDKMTRYLWYHVYKQTPYDMGFSITEDEVAVREGPKGILEYDFTKAPVPLYCTELVFRALREAGIAAPTASIVPGLAAKLAGIPRLPKGFVAKLQSPFVTADCFLKSGEVIFQTVEPPAPLQALGDVKDTLLRKYHFRLHETINRIKAVFTR
jgi:hypothetical protein